jgi:S-adenosylhomocysteine hydrolase
MSPHASDPQSEQIPQTLPLLEYVAEQKKIDTLLPFKDYKIIAVQHLLGSTIPFFEMLTRGGAEPKNIYIVGKAYSSHPLVVARLKKAGYQIDSDHVFDNAIGEPYDSVLESHIIATCQKLFETKHPGQKVLIIDDGGKAIKLLHHSFIEQIKDFTCLEQTSRGARVVESLKLLCPVINVARSEAKTIHESPFIARAMVHEFLHSLDEWETARVYKPLSKNVLLMGYGFIGENVANELLSHGFNLTIYDPEEKRRIKAQKNGLSILTDQNQLYNQDFTILVGASGTQVLAGMDLSRLPKNVLLVNMASTDTEFSAWNLRPQGKIIHQHVLQSDTEYLQKNLPLPWRSLYKITADKNTFFLANGGFPSDFSGKVNPIPAENIQLTSALLLYGAIQAVETINPGLIDLDQQAQNKIIAHYNSQIL